MFIFSSFSFYQSYKVLYKQLKLSKSKLFLQKFIKTLFFLSNTKDINEFQFRENDFYIQTNRFGKYTLEKSLKDIFFYIIKSFFFSQLQISWQRFIIKNFSGIFIVISTWSKNVYKRHIIIYLYKQQAAESQGRISTGPRASRYLTAMPGCSKLTREHCAL